MCAIKITDFADMKTDHADSTKYFPHKELSYKLIGLFYDVRNEYGTAQKESIYQNALAESLDQANIQYKREVGISILSTITQKKLGNYRIDFVIEDKVIVETKAVIFLPIKMERQIFSYIVHTPYEIGFLVNFTSPKFYFKRFILSNTKKNLRNL